MAKRKFDARLINRVPVVAKGAAGGSFGVTEQGPEALRPIQEGVNKPFVQKATTVRKKRATNR